MTDRDIPRRIRQYAWLAAFPRTALTACSFGWHCHLGEKQIVDPAYSKAINQRTFGGSVQPRHLSRMHGPAHGWNQEQAQV